MYKSAVYTVHYVTGWKAVKRDVLIPHNLPTTPLQIKTVATAGSGKELSVVLYTAGGDKAGIFQLFFTSSPKYKILNCITSWTVLPSTLPKEVNKVWQITKLPGPRITVQCNRVTVLDMSHDTCTKSSWNTTWSRKVEQIMFPGYDTASDEYWAAPPGNTLIIFNVTCLSSYYYHTVRIC